MPLTKPYALVKNSVVRVVALKDSNVVSDGSGSLIAEGQMVLTCEHCIISGTQPAIVDPQNPNRAVYGKVVFSDKANDIAVIQLPGVVGTPVKFADSTKCSVGNGAFVVGYPMGAVEQTLLSAYIASISSEAIRIDASVNHGNSGGPLFNLEGLQIGVVNAKHGSLSQFLKKIKEAQPRMSMRVGGIDPVEVIQVLIDEMQNNLNLGIGYAIPMARVKVLKPSLFSSVP